MLSEGGKGFEQPATAGDAQYQKDRSGELQEHRRNEKVITVNYTLLPLGDWCFLIGPWTILNS